MLGDKTDLFLNVACYFDRLTNRTSVYSAKEEGKEIIVYLHFPRQTLFFFGSNSRNAGQALVWDY